MSYYCLLQFTMLNRQLRDFGIHPILGYLLVIGGFVGISLLIFARLPYAPYMYMFLAVALMPLLQHPRRTRFLQICYGPQRYRFLRMAENLLLALPFIVFLCCKGYYWQGLALMPLAVTMAFVQPPLNALPALPTPFYRQPYESIVGFRANIGLIAACYALTVVAAVVGNGNLGLVALLGLFLVCLSFYQNAEPVLYVWVFALAPAAFLHHKIKRAIWHGVLLALPPTLLLAVCFAQDGLLLGGVFILGLTYLATMVLAKYAIFPHKLNLPHAIFLAVGMALPPLLLVLVPYFYVQSLKRLRPILS